MKQKKGDRPCVKLRKVVFNARSDLGNKRITGEKNMDSIWTELYNAAKEVQNPRQISDYVSGGENERIIKLGDITPEWWIGE